MPSTTWTPRRWTEASSLSCDNAKTDVSSGRGGMDDAKVCDGTVRLSSDALARALALYAITDRRWLAGRTLESQVEAAIEGGATMVQLREKDLVDAGDNAGDSSHDGPRDGGPAGLSEDAFLAEAERIKAVCNAHDVPFLIDDDVELARRVGADGVHVGQSDMEAGAARELVGPGMVLGVSAGTVEEALLAQERGADYLGVGAVFPTGSKDDAEAVSHETLAAICRAVDIPVVAIGGITRDNLTELAGTGIAGISVISAIFAQPDTREAARDLRERVDAMLGA